MAKTKALISFAVTAKLICVFVFAYAKIRFSHDPAHKYIDIFSRAIREAYIQNGGNDQILINQLRQMEQDARDLEEDMKRRQQEKPKGTLVIELSHYNMSLVVRKPVFGVSDQVRHKQGCTITEDG